MVAGFQEKMAGRMLEQVMRKVVIVDGDILTPLGDLQSTWKNLLAGKSGIHRQGLGAMQGLWPLGIIEDIGEGAGSWERFQQLFKRLFTALPVLPENTQLICATTKAAVDELLNTDQKFNGQPWQVADWLANHLTISGHSTTVSAACASGTLAIIQGAMRIRNGECDHVLVVGFDLLAEFILTGFDSLKALSVNGAKPFDQHRDGLSLGEGAGWLLLSAENLTQSTDKPLAHINNWGISCDATHITAPCRNASGLINLFTTMTSDGSIHVGGINAHGTGTVYNDAMELLAFSTTCEEGMPVCSTKGALGHSLGAAGIIEAMLSVMSLRDSALPPTFGLSNPAASSCALSGTEILKLRYPSIVSCNSGFGGINAALLLTR
jgi:3-oxoacyl-(acyl-carrier-protein) synthase